MVLNQSYESYARYHEAFALVGAVACTESSASLFPVRRTQKSSNIVLVPYLPYRTAPTDYFYPNLCNPEIQVVS